MSKEIFTEATEICPYCESENVYPNWDTEKQGYIAVCNSCGSKISLCDECLHADDNPTRQCDWREEFEDGKAYGVCFRGTTTERE